MPTKITNILNNENMVHDAKDRHSRVDVKRGIGDVRTTFFKKHTILGRVLFGAALLARPFWRRIFTVLRESLVSNSNPNLDPSPNSNPSPSPSPSPNPNPNPNPNIRR